MSEAGSHSRIRRRGRKRVAIVAFPPVRELDVVGPVDVFATANRLAGEDLYSPVIAGAEGAGTIVGMSGLSLVGETTLRAFRGAVDTLLIPGGWGCENLKPKAATVTSLRKLADRSRRVGSVCTGAFLLARTGLLDGRRATTHWSFSAQLAAAFPEVEVDAAPIWIRDGKYYTSAGVTAGIDLSLALVEEDHGAALALQVARNLVVFLRRPGSQAQFSVSLNLQAGDRNPFHELLVWIADHVGDDLSVPRLAERAAMSPRNFHRVFVATTGKSPARFVEEARVEASCRLLETSDLSLDAIAERSGFGDADVMRRSFLRHLDSSPARYRRHFQTSKLT
ncbi:MAG TPA: GlxA family transcriptional regulator [Chthoniobacterales bacterium]|nr:GlxA family transcriptional regulator [Chthoniobacterales bacterium]